MRPVCRTLVDSIHVSIPTHPSRAFGRWLADLLLKRLASVPISTSHCDGYFLKSSHSNPISQKTSTSNRARGPLGQATSVCLARVRTAGEATLARAVKCVSLHYCTLHSLHQGARNGPEEKGPFVWGQAKPTVRTPISRTAGFL